MSYIHMYWQQTMSVTVKQQKQATEYGLIYINTYSDKYRNK